MSTGRSLSRLSAVVAPLLLAALLGACGTDAGQNAQPTASRVPTYSEPADTPAAKLRSEFTAALMDWTWIAAQAAGPKEGESATAAATALENSTVGVAGLIGRQYRGAEQPMLAVLRSRDVALQKYAKGDKEAARRELDQFRAEFGNVMTKYVPKIPAAQFAEALKPHVDGLLQVIDASEPGERLRLLVAAANATAPAGEAIAAGITADRQLAGDPQSPAAALRADLTRVLVNHGWLVGSLGRSGGGEAAEAALEANNVAIADIFARHYPEAREPLLTWLREHVGLLKKYLPVASVQAGDVAAKAPVRVELENHRRIFGDIVSRFVPEVTPPRAADLLAPYLGTALLALDSQKGGDTRWYVLLPQLSAQLQTTAGSLAGAIAKNKGLEG